MIIRNFEKFKLFLEKDSTIYEYGCIMVYLNIPNWNRFISKINYQDLYEPNLERYGLEEEPHCTILYGIHSDVSDDEVVEKFSGLSRSDFDLVVNGVDCFYNKDYDVLKLNVKSNKLSELNEMAKSLPHTSAFPDYKPHITLGYLQKGRGIDYVDPTFNINLDNTIEKIVYSKPNGQKIDISLY
jgi:2'-5' RNA ligase